MVVASLFGALKGFLDHVTGVWFPQPIGARGAAAELFVAVLLAPLFETWIAQSLVLDELSKVRFFGAKPGLVFVVSVLCFGLQHFYSLGYLIYGCAGGTVLAYAFVATGRRARGYWATALVHAAWNLTVFLVQRASGGS